MEQILAVGTTQDGNRWAAWAPHCYAYNLAKQLTPTDEENIRKVKLDDGKYISALVRKKTLSGSVSSY